MEPKIHLHVLASGSKGNAAVVEGPAGSVLIDCGLSLRELRRRADELGANVDDLEAVLVTHEHADHTSGLRVLSNNCDGELIATTGTASARSDLLALPFSLISHDETLEIAGMVGFDTQNYFNAQFTRHVGVPPKQYRENYVIGKRRKIRK